MSSEQAWAVMRLKWAVDTNPTKSEVRALDQETQVSFVPMESVGEYGGMELDTSRPIGQVMSGYTYFRDGDVVVAKITPCFENGKGALANELENGIAFGTTELHVLRPKEGTDATFLFYLSISDRFRRVGESTMYGAGGQKRISDDFVEEFLVSRPPLPTQRAIGDFLDRETEKVDTLIEKKERLLELLDEKRTASITQAVTKGLDPDVPMKDSGVEWLGEIPEHWEVAKVKRVVSAIHTGVSVRASSNHSAGPDEVGVLSTSSVLGDEFRPAQNKLVDSDDIERVSCTVTGDTLLVSRMNTPALVGSTAYVDATYSHLFLPDRLWRLKLLEGACLAKFLWLVLRTPGMRRGLSMLATGASGSMRTLAQDDFLGARFPLPPLEDQSRIVASVEMSLALIARSSQAIQEGVDLLSEYRTALISAAVTGQIDVTTQASA